MGRRPLLAVSVAAALLLGGSLAAAIALTSGGGAPAPAGVAGAARIATLLDGIPQHGTVLGDPAAPVTLVEFADIQCPYCAVWEERALPELVRRYVRSGDVQIRFSGMTFVGPDSVTAFRTALAAAEQGRFWNVLALLFANQGGENTGWVTEGLLRSIGASVPGLDVEAMLAARSEAAVDRRLDEAAALAEQAGIRSTPTFAVGRTGSPLAVVQLASLDADGIAPALEAALAQ